ncbi:MAG: hypothetical protein WA584_04220 [Pyrinomonadaceae bacterium]
MLICAEIYRRAVLTREQHNIEGFKSKIKQKELPGLQRVKFFIKVFARFCGKSKLRCFFIFDVRIDFVAKLVNLRKLRVMETDFFDYFFDGRFHRRHRGTFTKATEQKIETERKKLYQNLNIVEREKEIIRKLETAKKI